MARLHYRHYRTAAYLTRVSVPAAQGLSELALVRPQRHFGKSLQPLSSPVGRVSVLPDDGIVERGEIDALLRMVATFERVTTGTVYPTRSSRRRAISR